MFTNTEVTLRKQNGEEYTNIPADVQPKIIFVDDDMLPIEENDYIIRKLPNGLEEKYIVINRGFYGDHYQVEVRRA